MYKVDISQKTLTKLESPTFSDMKIKERFDIQEWVVHTPQILGENLLIIANGYILPSGKELDVLALDDSGALVVIELKRDDSGASVDWQAIRYTAWCSTLSPTEIVEIYAEFMGGERSQASGEIEDFIDCQIDQINEAQRIIIASRGFHPDVLASVIWLRDHNVDISCVRLRNYVNDANELYLDSDILIPMPDAKDFILKREKKEARSSEGSVRSPFSMEKSNFDIEELEKRLASIISSINPTLSQRLVAFFGILLEEERSYSRDEIKSKFHGEYGIGDSVGHAGRLLSNVSQLVTKKRFPELRQVIEFDSRGGIGDLKNNYSIVSKYRDLVRKLIDNLN